MDVIQVAALAVAGVLLAVQFKSGKAGSIVFDLSC